ncbi:unannotated protein [freshwater metagenome]|uniref:Unannotated protein n=1 Tax=freshwater metagenome TaxID=449393 RepID=A0A6J7HHE3_9ZZZZ
MRNSLGRLIRVDRYVGTARRDDRVNSDEELHRTTGSDRHGGLGADTTVDEVPRKTSHPYVELAVGHRLVTEYQCGSVGFDRPPEGGQRLRPVDVVVGVVPVVEHALVLDVVEQFDVAHDGREVVGDGFEDLDQALTQGDHRGLVEQVGGVGDIERHTLRRATGSERFDERELQVEQCNQGLEVDARDRQSR